MADLERVVREQSVEINELRSQLSYYISSYLCQPEFDSERTAEDFRFIKSEMAQLRLIMRDFQQNTALLDDLQHAVQRMAACVDQNAFNQLIYDYYAQTDSNEKIIKAQKAEIELLKRRLIYQEDKNFSQVLKLQSLEKIVLQREITAQEVKDIENEVGRVVGRLVNENQALKRQIDVLASEHRYEKPRLDIIDMQRSACELEDFVLPESPGAGQKVRLVRLIHSSCQEHNDEVRRHLELQNMGLQTDLFLERKKTLEHQAGLPEAALQQQIEQYREIIDCLREQIAILKYKARLSYK